MTQLYAFLRRLRCRLFGHSEPPKGVALYFCRHCDSLVLMSRAGR